MKKATSLVALLVLIWACQRVELDNLGDKKVDLKVNFVTGPSASMSSETKSTKAGTSDVVFGNNGFKAISHEQIDLEGFNLRVYASETPSENLIYEKYFSYDDFTFEADFGSGVRCFEIIASNESHHVPGIYGFKDCPVMPEGEILFMHFHGQTQETLSVGEDKKISVNAFLDNAGAELVFEPPIGGAYQGEVFYKYLVSYELLGNSTKIDNTIMVGEVDLPDDDPFITKNEVSIDYEGNEPLALDFVDAVFMDENNDPFYRWILRNGSDNSYSLDWSLNGTDEKGKIQLPAHKSIYFSTNNKGEEMVVKGGPREVSLSVSSKNSSELRKISEEKRKYYPKALINKENSGLRICGLQRTFIVDGEVVDTHDMSYQGKPVSQNPLLFKSGKLARIIVENDLHVVDITPVIEWQDWDKEEVIITK